MIQLTRIVLRMLPAVLVAGFLTGGAVMADDDGGVLSTLIGSSPGQSVGGVPSAGAPWTLSKAHVTLNGGGHFNLVVDGLILPSTGNTGPVSQVSASLVCGGSGGTVVATTGAVALSTSGGAWQTASVRPFKRVAVGTRPPSSLRTCDLYSKTNPASLITLPPASQPS